MCALVALGYVTADEKDLAIFLLVIAVGINSATYLGFQVSTLNKRKANYWKFCVCFFSLSRRNCKWNSIVCHKLIFPFQWIAIFFLVRFLRSTKSGKPYRHRAKLCGNIDGIDECRGQCYVNRCTAIGWFCCEKRKGPGWMAHCLLYFGWHLFLWQPHVRSIQQNRCTNMERSRASW